MNEREKHPIFSRLALSLGTLLILFVFLEIILRFTGSYTHEPLLFDPELGYVPKPNSEVTTVTPEYTTTKYINSEGFWGKEYPHEKPEGVARIVVLGDSFTEARQVPTEQAYPALLEERLRSEGRNVEVINLGRGGYGTTKENYILERFGLAYEPDWIILSFFVGNDIMNNRTERDLGEHVLTGWKKIKINAKTFLINNFATVRFYLKEKGRNKILAYLRGDLGIETKHIIPTDLNVFYSDLPNDAQEGYTLTEEQLTRLKNIAETYGAKPLVVIIPDRMQVYEEYRLPEYKDFDYDKPNRKLTAFMKERGIPSIDLLSIWRIYATEHPKESLYGALDSHYNKAGHAQMAEVLAQYLKDKL